MTVRHAVLPIGAVLVLGLGVYLLLAVRAQPSPIYATRDRSPHAAAPAAEDVAPAPPEPTPAIPPSPAGAADPPLSPPPAIAAPAGAPSTPPETDPALAGPKLDAVMAEANKAYDRGDFDEAKLIASRVLARFPSNVRMLRIMVSASCIEGDAAVAQTHFMKLPPGDQEQMKVRCAGYGVSFSDGP